MHSDDIDSKITPMNASRHSITVKDTKEDTLIKAPILDMLILQICVNKLRYSRASH